MRLGIQLVFGFALVLGVGFAQESASKPPAVPPPGMKGVIERIKKSMLGEGEPKNMTFRLGLVPVCSVPLTVYRPADPEPNAIRIPAESNDNMPTVALPAPPCK